MRGVAGMLPFILNLHARWRWVVPVRLYPPRGGGMPPHIQWLRSSRACRALYSDTFDPVGNQTTIPRSSNPYPMHNIDCAIPAHNNPGYLHEWTKLFPFCRTIRSDVGTLAQCSVTSLTALHQTKDSVLWHGTQRVTNTKSFLANVKVSCNCKESAARILIFVTLLQKLCNGFCGDKLRHLDFYAVPLWRTEISLYLVPGWVIRDFVLFCCKCIFFVEWLWVSKGMCNQTRRVFFSLHLLVPKPGKELLRDLEQWFNGELSFN